MRRVPQEQQEGAVEETDDSTPWTQLLEHTGEETDDSTATSIKHLFLSFPASPVSIAPKPNSLTSEPLSAGPGARGTTTYHTKIWDEMF